MKTGLLLIIYYFAHTVVVEAIQLRGQGIRGKSGIRFFIVFHFQFHARLNPVTLTQFTLVADALVEFDVMNVFKIPLEEGVDFVDGSDGFPAFRVSAGADVKSPYRLVLPEKLEEFAIMASIRPETRTGGYIFSVVNPMDTIVQIGLYASEPTEADRWNITFYYTDSATHMTSQALATFEAPFSKKWTKLAIKVLYNRVIFYHNCIELETRLVSKVPSELVFDSASTLYLAQAGPILGRKFEVSPFSCPN